jgi:hypothetical protein
VRVPFRADAFNVFIRAQYGAPNADTSQVAFGTITTTVSNYATGRGTPRESRLSAKILFLAIPPKRPSLYRTVAYIEGVQYSTDNPNRFDISSIQLRPAFRQGVWGKAG